MPDLALPETLLDMAFYKTFESSVITITEPKSTHSFSLTISATICSTGVDPSRRCGYKRSIVSTPRRLRLCSQAIGTYAASPRNPKPVGNRTAPNFVARKISLRFSGFRAIHLPMITSESPYTQDLVLVRLCNGCTGNLVDILHRSRSYPKRCIQLRTPDRGEQGARDQEWEPSFESRESPFPSCRSQCGAPTDHLCPMGA